MCQTFAVSSTHKGTERPGRPLASDAGAEAYDTTKYLIPFGAAAECQHLISQNESSLYETPDLDGAVWDSALG